MRTRATANETNRQGTVLQLVSKRLCTCLSESTSDLGISVGDCRVGRRRGEHLAIKHNGKGLLSLLGQVFHAQVAKERLHGAVA